MSTLNEGMRRYDLEDMVLPMITIDEYVSKVDDKAVVIGFYVGDQDAARDLNRFLQKSPINMLDTDISPAPDQRGYYLVFVEMLNTDMVAKNIKSLCRDVENLTGISKWQMRIRGISDILPLESKPIIKHFEKLRDEVSEGRVLHFLSPSILRSARLVEDQLYLDGKPVTFVDFGDIDYLLNRHDLQDQRICLDSYSKWQCDKLRERLGDGWIVDEIGAFKVIHRGGEVGILVQD